MTKKEIIEFTISWIRANDFNGPNCDKPEFDDNGLVYYLESPNLLGWIRQCYFNIPENFYDWKEKKQVYFLMKKYEEQLKEWVEDDRDFYMNIAFASGLDDSYVNVVEKIIDNYSDFEEARCLLKRG